MSDADALKERVRTLGPSLEPATVDVTATTEKGIHLSAAYGSQVRAFFGTPGRLRDEMLEYVAGWAGPYAPGREYGHVRLRGELREGGGES